MNAVISSRLNIVYPIYTFSNNFFSFKTKYIIIKYNFIKTYINNILACKYIIIMYNIFLKKLKCYSKKNTLSRKNLSRSTKKPWNQKGLGKARSGSFKSPIWKGGSTLFGPISKISNIYLQRKNKKMSFCYLLLNKRTYISFLTLMPIFHSYNKLQDYLNQQKRIRGIFSNKVCYVFLNEIEYLSNKNYFFIPINSLNITHILMFEYIVFLI